MRRVTVALYNTGRSLIMRFEFRAGAVCRRCAAAAALVLSAAPLAAQEVIQAGAQRASRAELTVRVTQLEQQVTANNRKSENAKAQAELAAIRLRIEQGDFRVGDRFVVTIRQDSVRSDTVSVRDSLKVSLLNLPDVSIAGVLRSELDERMSAHVGKYLRNVDVRTNVLTRISILGAVQRPGFYYAAPDRSLSDLVMLAGGPAPTANLAQLEVSRGRAKVIKAKNSKQLLKEGRTLEQMDVQSGDEVRIPEKRRVNWQLVIQVLFILSSLAFAFVNFLRWYYERQDI